YRKLLASSTGTALVHVVDRIGSLNIFEGEFLLRDDDKPTRNHIFTECRDVVERIADIPEAVDTYHYYKLSCSALWVESATPLQLIGVGSYFKQYFAHFVTDDMNLRPELDADPRRSGGGIYRIIAAVAADPLSSMVHAALPSTDKAFEMIELALASPAYPGEHFAGADVYTNRRTKAEIMHGAGRTAEARALLESAIAEIEERLADDDVAEEIRPETVAEINKMREVLENLSQE
ncbi:MAG: hypothetical protein RIQ81_631, partial [Pseudomonadota bacterium]